MLSPTMTSPFFSEVAQGIEQGFDRSPYRLLFASARWQIGHPHQEARALRLLLRQRVDGLIILGGQAPAEYLRQLAQRLPLVIVGRHVAGLEPHCLQSDNFDGAYRAARYLIGLGHTRIAHISGTPSNSEAQARLAGYRRALAEAGLQDTPALIAEGAFNAESGRLATQRLLARGERFTALFVANDQMTYGALRELFARSLRVPEDVSVVGFDDLVLSAYTAPPLTTVRQPISQMGTAAAHAMLRMLAGQPPDIPTFPTELVIRSSAATRARGRPD